MDALDRGGTPSLRDAVIRVFRCLDSFGVGRFIPGRKGHVTPFEWWRNLSQCEDVPLTTKWLQSGSLVKRQRIFKG